MAIIKSTPFSFVRFEHPAEDGHCLDINYSLPAYGGHDISFQFIVEADRPLNTYIRMYVADEYGAALNLSQGFAASVMSYRYRLQGLTETALFELHYIDINFNNKVYGGITVTYDMFAAILERDFGVELVDDYFVLPDNTNVEISASHGGQDFWEVVAPVWHQGHVALSGLPLDAAYPCFTYALLDDATNALLGYSNLFKVWDSEVYTSQVAYLCKEDAFGFVYDSALRTNRVRLPFYLTQPQWPKKREVYRKSNGKSQLLSATMEKEYSIVTEQMPEVFHECMSAMLIHDTVTIENRNIREGTVEVVEAENYTPEWNTDQNILFATAKGKIKVASYGYSNSNC